MKERKQYSKEFKQGAVRLVTDQGRSVADVSKSLGIPSWSLSRWLRAAKSDGPDAFRGNGHRTALEQEIFELRQKVSIPSGMRRDAIQKVCLRFALSPRDHAQP